MSYHVYLLKVLISSYVQLNPAPGTHNLSRRDHHDRAQKWLRRANLQWKMADGGRVRCGAKVARRFPTGTSPISWALLRHWSGHTQMTQQLVYATMSGEKVWLCNQGWLSLQRVSSLFKFDTGFSFAVLPILESLNCDSGWKDESWEAEQRSEASGVRQYNPYKWQYISNNILIHVRKNYHAWFYTYNTNNIHIYI